MSELHNSIQQSDYVKRSKLKEIVCRSNPITKPINILKPARIKEDEGFACTE